MNEWRLAKYRCTWTNWTFGVWWGRLTKRSPMHLGIDFGPLEWLFTKDEPDRRIPHHDDVAASTRRVRRVH